MSSGSHTVVIGAGFGGMASALRARARGERVTVLERCPRLGGRAQVYERDGFRHDAGPTVITAPFLFDELFALFNRDRRDYFELLALETWYRFQFADGSHLDYGADLKQTLAQIEAMSPGDGDGYRTLLEHSKKLFDIGYVKLGDHPFHRFSSMLKCLPALMRLRADRSVWQLTSRCLRDDRLRRAFSIQPLLVGGNPFETTSIYSLIHYLERRWGVHFARGGTGAIVGGLERLMREQGITIRTETTVDRIKSERGHVSGVELSDGETLEADRIIANVDPSHLYRHMLAPKQQRLSARLKRRCSRSSMGLFVLYFGSTRQYPDVAHHTIWFGQRYRSLLADIFRKHQLSEDFSLYLHRPTATDPSFAPAGCDSFYVLAPVPNLRGEIDWNEQGPRLQQRILRALGETILPDIESHATATFYKTPEDFQSSYLSHEGAGFSVAPLFRQSAWFRYHNQAEGPRGLYLVGAGTHPGAGVPGVLTSAKVLDQLLQPATTPGLTRTSAQAAS